jgi:hypothetical protein
MIRARALARRARSFYKLNPMKFLALLAALFISLVSAHAEEPASFDVGGLKFARPADWKWVEVTSPMRKAQLQVPGTGAQVADITFFHFGAQGGGDATSNAQRWLNQFKGDTAAQKIEPQEIAGTKVTLVTTEGTFSSGMPGGALTPVENQALLGAIIEGPEGNIFIKMTGPSALVKGLREKFLAFITAALPKK